MLTVDHEALDAEMKRGNIHERTETFADYLRLTALAMRPAAEHIATGDTEEASRATQLVVTQLDDLMKYTHALYAAFAIEGIGNDILDHISTEDAREVLWHFGDRENGHQPGSFAESLLVTITRADPRNRALLMQTFPGLVLGVSMAQIEAGGMDALRDLIIDRTAP